MPVRTRACSVCRKKRIKCDGSLPHCLMCARTGRLCPGPLQGPMIVDMTANAKNGMKRRCTTKHVKLNVGHNTQIDRIGRAPVQILVTEAFYVNVLTHFTVEGEGKDIQNQLAWLQRLPALATDRSNDALVLALEATATAYGAIMSSQTALSKHSRTLYGAALRAHHGLLQRSESKHDITIHAVSTSVLLSFFEAMQATTADSYRAHIYGAARLLEITGPGECAHGVLCQLFYHVRTQMLFVQLASDQGDIPIAAKRILYDTLMYNHPPLIQRLMCCIAGLMDLRTKTSGTQEQKKPMYAFLKLQVDQLWSEYSQRMDDDLNLHDTVPTKSDLFRDAFAALTVAYFSSANVVLTVYCPDSVDLTDMKHHVQLILDAAVYLDTDRNPIAFMRMATPLLLVALHGHCLEQRKRATGKFEIWSRRSMRGISALALNAVHRQVEKSI